MEISGEKAVSSGPTDLRRGEGQALALRFAARFLLPYRSAGACPPRWFDPNEKRL